MICIKNKEMNWKKKMVGESLKDTILYSIPNWFFLKVYRNNNRADFIYCKIESDDKQGLSFLETIQLAISLGIAAILFPFILIYLFVSIFFFNKIFLHRIEIALTTCCSLRCKACSNLMQYYEKPSHVDVEVVKESIDSLLGCVDSIQKIVFLGGEPFLYPDLLEVIEYAKKCSKIKTIQIISNGIARMNAEKLEVLNNDKVFVSISDYGIFSDKIDQTCALLSDNEVRFVRVKQMKWFDFGDLENKGRAPHIVQQQFDECIFKCKCVFNGKMFLCPRASHGTDLGYYNDRANVDLLAVDDLANLKREILRLYYRKEHIEACRYCNAGTNDCKVINCGEQREIKKK